MSPPLRRAQPDAKAGAAATRRQAVLAAAFNELRDADMIDDDRLARGRLLCEELYEKCGKSTKEVSE